MERGLRRATKVLVILMLPLLSATFVMTPVVGAQSGQWVVTISLQTSLSEGMATVTVSGSGSETLNSDGQGRITGTGSFQGTITVAVTSGCTGGGTIPFSESETYSGQLVDPATGNATIVATATGSSAPATVTMTCPNPNPPPATVTYPVPIPSQMATVGGTYSVLLVDGYSYKYNFPAPMSGSFSMVLRGGITATTSATTTSSTTEANGTLRLTVPLGAVQLCDSAYNNCMRVSGGETLQPGECIITSSGSAVTALSGNMNIAIGENSMFCLPPTRAEISSLCSDAQIYATIQGQLHVGTWGLHLGQNIYVTTPYMSVCDKGTEFIVQASASEATVMVVNQSVIVTDLTSKSSVMLISHQMITVRSSTSGAGQAGMQAVKYFDPSTVDKWGLAITTTSTSVSGAAAPSIDIPTIAYAAVPVIVVLIAALALSRSRSRKSAPA